MPVIDFIADHAKQDTVLYMLQNQTISEVLLLSIALIFHLMFGLLKSPPLLPFLAHFPSLL